MCKRMVKILMSIFVVTLLTLSVFQTGFCAPMENNNADLFSVRGEINGFLGLDDELLSVAVVYITPINSKTPAYVKEV